MHGRLESLFIFCTVYFLALACSSKSKRELVKVSDKELKESQKTELEALVDEELERRDENGKLQELQGFTKTDKLDSDLLQGSEQVFEFIPPDGIDAEFSEPVMINGATLFLTSNHKDLKAKCEGLAYQPQEPTVKEILEHSQKKNICGKVTVNFCIRLKTITEAESQSPNYTYTESPDLTLSLPCPGDSFQDLKIEIAEGKSHTVKSSEKVNLQSLRSVISVYLTNSPDCLAGGEWQQIQKEDPNWNMVFVDGVATVYGKFMDVFGAESECLSDTIAYGSTADQCFANDPNFLSQNILSGVNIGEIEGTAALSYPACTSDGQVGCIASSTYKAANADELSVKVITGQTVGGIAGSVAVETHTNCSIGGQKDCIKL